MRKVSLIAAVLIASNATAGEIVWRSSTSGTLSVASDPAPPPTEPGQPALDLRYETIRMAAGTVVNAMLIGDVSGYAFAAGNPLPPGLTLDPITGKLLDAQPSQETIASPSGRKKMAPIRIW